MWSSFFRWKRREPGLEATSDGPTEPIQVDNSPLALETGPDSLSGITRTYKPSPAPSMVWITTGGCRDPLCACVEGSFRAESGNVASLVCQNNYCTHVFSKHSTDEVQKPEYTPGESNTFQRIPDCMCPKLMVSLLPANITNRLVSP